MKGLIFFLTWAFADTAFSHVLLERAACNADNCARAITGTNAKPSISVRQTDCAKFMTAVVYPPATTITVTANATISAAAKRDFGVTLAARQATSSGIVPSYATACSGASRYSSACSCWGYTTATTTAATPTSTVTVMAATSSSAPFDTHDYGCQDRLVSDSFAFPFSDYCTCTFLQYCGFSGYSSTSNTVLTNPPNSHNLGFYQYCYYECNRRASCVGYSYDFRGSGTCKLYEMDGADETHTADFAFEIAGDEYSVAGFKYLPSDQVGYECGVCPLRA